MINSGAPDCNGRQAINDITYRPKLSVEDQIVHMKNQGIKFTIMNEQEAAEYLTYNTYYFKLKAYAKLYDKYSNTGDPSKDGKYMDLEFAYLKDLATIDAYLRKIILQISLDIEHYLKVALLRDFNRSDEDGYEIVSEFLSFNESHYKEEFAHKLDGKACSNLIRKYDGHFAIWNIIEVLGLNDFKELYRFFYTRNGSKLYASENKQKGPYLYYINPVRVLRNASAHNNCLLNSLKTPYVDEDHFNNNPSVSAFMGKHGIKNRTMVTNMSKPFVHDFCVMLYLYHQIAPESAQKHVFPQLRDTFQNRFAKHGEYYVNKNTTICAAYDFILKVINMYYTLLKLPVENS